MNYMQVLIMALVGGSAAMLANSGVAVFNDGLRPILPEYLEGRITKAELAATSFAISFGLVVGFGIPVSIGATILLAHSVLLMTDIIGTWTPDGQKGIAISGFLGALWGVALLIGLQVIVDLFSMMPINFLDALGKVGSPIVIGFSVFPAIAVARQHSFKKGFITFSVCTLILFLVKKYGTFQINEITTLTLSAEGMTLLTGMIFMIYFAARIKGDTTESSDLVGMFTKRVGRIKKNTIWLALAGGFISSATSLILMAGDPISLNLMNESQFGSASLAAFARAIGFIPLVFSTAIVTGVYSPAGTTLVYVAGILLQGRPLIAFIIGGVIMFIEVNLLGITAKGLDRFPGIRDMGGHIRESMNDVLEIALLIGGAIASEAIAPGVGYFWVFGAYLLNKSLNKPIVSMAVGPIAAIALGVLVNIFYVLGLYVPVG